MTTYSDFLKPERRLSILQTLTAVKGSANDQVLHSAIEQLGFVRVPHSEVMDDLRFLIQHGLIIDEWVGDVQVCTITRRGCEVAEGRVEVPGVKLPAIGI